jgi:mannose-6-phosphate isomerase-like protein (cupin superfamily)
MKGVIKNKLESNTLKNENYRKVVNTTDNMQLVLMKLKPEEEIPLEKHANTDQFIRVESGAVIIYSCSTKRGNFKKQTLKSGDAVIIPRKNWHRVKNNSKINAVKLYTIYSPPNHPEGLIRKVQSD